MVSIFLCWWKNTRVSHFCSKRDAQVVKKKKQHFSSVTMLCQYDWTSCAVIIYNLQISRVWKNYMLFLIISTRPLWVSRWPCSASFTFSLWDQRDGLFIHTFARFYSTGKVRPESHVLATKCLAQSYISFFPHNVLTRIGHMALPNKKGTRNRNAPGRGKMKHFATLLTIIVFNSLLLSSKKLGPLNHHETTSWGKHSLIKLFYKIRFSVL